MIPALVLSAGHATRLRPLSLVRAKAAFPVAGEPLVRRILRWLSASGATDAVVNLHHLPGTITGVVGDGTDLGLRVRYSWESPVLGSAGGPRRAIPLLGSETFVIVNGDTLTSLDPGRVIAHHRASGALVTLALVPNTRPDQYGGVLVDDDDRVTGFRPRGSPERSYHFFGVQVVESRAFETVPGDTPWESIGQLYPALMEQDPGSVRAFRCAEDWWDIGTPADYLETSLRLCALEGRPLVSAGQNTRIAATADVERSILWDDVIVEAGARLRECIVADGARIPEDTAWHGVSLRVADGTLAPGERRIGELAVAPIDGGRGAG